MHSRHLAAAALVCLLLAPSAHAQTWTLLTRPPSAVNACMLLTDGGVMCQSDTAWYKLTPDSTGSYQNGTWLRLASLPAGYGPTFYGSAVLADGRVVLVGGEYSFGEFSLTGMGAVYDPLADSWQTLAPPAGTHFQCLGDVSTVVMPNGKLLMGAKLFQDLALLDPVTLQWTVVSSSGKIDPSNSEEGWNLLPDGSVFTLDVAAAPAAERFIFSGPSTGAWVFAGFSLQDLHTPPTDQDVPLQAPGCPIYKPPGEMGPSLLRPDGTVFAVGANGLTGIYTPPEAGSTATGSWAVGPAMPSPLNVQDGPAALLPNGHVLFGGSPGEDAPGLQYFEFDGTRLISVPAPQFTTEDDTEATQLLVLPTGQVLFVDGTVRVQIYTPAATPMLNPGWSPTITSISPNLNNGTTYQITGTQFNGLSQGSAYGDELENSTNYPLVRITNDATGHVFYARTHDHSTMAVATGTTPVSTNFDVPLNIEAGASHIEVVANGLASPGLPVTVFTPIIPLTISTTSLPDAVVNAPYSTTLTASGGTPPYTWQVVSNSLPNGLVLNSTTGQITGTPTTLLTNSPVLFKVSDSSGPAQTARATLNLTIASVLTIGTTALPIGQINVSYSKTLTPNGGIGPYTWQITSGTLPGGLTLDTSAGVLVGTPQALVSGVLLTFLVTDSAVPTPQTVSTTLNLTVIAAPLGVTSISLPDGEVNVAYTANLVASGGATPYTWQLSSGSLPSGLSLNSQAGTISGISSVPVGLPLTFKVTDSSAPAQTASFTANLIIASALTINTASLPNGQVNLGYSGVLSATGAIPPYSWQLASGTLPAGLTLNSQSGQITGTPTSVVNNVPLTFKATDSSVPSPQTASVGLTLTIAPQPLTILTTPLPNGVVNASYSATLSANGGITPYSWQLSAGSLPTGLSLVASTGQIKGSTATVVTNLPLTFQVTDAGSPVAQTVSVSLMLTIAPVLTIASTPLSNGQVTIPYSAGEAASGGIPPYSWQLATGVLPAGLTLNSSTGAVTGTPLVAVANLPLTFKVTDSSIPISQTATAVLSLTVIPSPLTISTIALPSAQAGFFYAANLVALGGTAPYTWQLTSGSLPAGLSLNSQTGQISGTPAVVVPNTPLTFKVTDSSAPTAQTASVSLNFAVTPSTVTVTTAALPNGQLNTPYSATLAASGGVPPYRWSARRLPNGLSLNGQTGQITGTPTDLVSNSLLSFTVTDSSSPTAQSASVALSFTVTAVGVSILTSSLSNGTVNASYTASLAATGGQLPYTWQLISGSLPNGLSLNAQSGQISGTPTVSVTNLPLTFRVSDSTTPFALTATVGLSLTITSSTPPPFTITTTFLPAGQVGVIYAASVTATGGAMPYKWQLTSGALPSGLSLNTQSGLISGTPVTAATNTPLTFKVTDSSAPFAQTASVTLNLTVNGTTPAGLTITTTVLPNGQVNVPYSAMLSAIGGIPPYTWSTRRLPGGLSFNSQTGQITGTPTDLASTLLSFTVTDSSSTPQTAVANLSLTVAVTAVNILTTSLSSGTVGAGYSSTLIANGGAAPYTWQLISGSLPSGLTLNSQSGLISGTPTSAVTNLPLTFRVNDSTTPIALTATIGLSLTVTSSAPSPLTITTGSLPSGQVGAFYAASVSATGGAPPYTWQLVSGALPVGLTLNTQTGQITGTPGAAVPGIPLTFKVGDSSTPFAKTATVGLTLTITSTTPTILTVTTTTLPSGQVNLPYSATLSAIGGVAPYTWSCRRLPSGLALNAQTGQISGTPSDPESNGLLIFTVNDSSLSNPQTASGLVSLTINPATGNVPAQEQ